VVGARVAVVVGRDRLAEALVEVLRRSPAVETCARLALSASGSTTGPDLPAARAFLARLVASPIRHAVIISSAAVYCPQHSNVGLLGEDAFIPEGRSDIADHWIEVERLASRIGEHSGAAAPQLTVLRPSSVLDGIDYFSRLLTGRIAITYPGHDPTLQLMSPSDLAGAVAAVVTSRAAGVYNVAPSCGIPLKAALKTAGVPRFPLGRLAQNAVRVVSSGASLTAPPDQLTYIQYSWTVSAEKLRRDTGFFVAATSEEAVAALTGRRPAVPGEYDEFGMDAPYIRRYCRHLFKWLHDGYWRIELAGLEHVPEKGRVVAVGMHRGFMPFDGVMLLFALVTRRGRIPRFLIHPSLTKFPFLADFMAKLGGIMACQENGEWVLRHDEILGIFPEGIRGAFTMYDKAYTLGKFGRDEFVRMALRHRAPILPFVTVGHAEIYPIFRRVDWKWFSRYTEWPFLPVTVPFPLPSKWHTQFLAPLHVEEQYGPEAADDPKIVRRISLEVRQQMQAAVDEMLLRRKSIFYGAIFDEDARVSVDRVQP